MKTVSNHGVQLFTSGGDNLCMSLVLANMFLGLCTCSD